MRLALQSNLAYKRAMEQVLSLSSIRARKGELNRTILDAQAQLADLDVAERIVLRFGETTADVRPDADAMEDLLQRANLDQAKSRLVEVMVDRALTSRALFQSVLRQSEEPWMTANQIQERASAIKGQDVPMATVSPTLSNMKNDGLIVRDGLKVALTERVKENEAPSGSAAGASETGTDANPFLPSTPSQPNDEER